MHKKVTYRLFSRMKLALLVLFLLQSGLSNCQFSIQGVIKDESSKGIEFVAVTLSRDSVVLQGVLTDSVGRFILNVEEAGNYSLSFRSYESEERSIDFLLKSDTTLDVVLKSQAEIIPEIIVTAKVPIVIKKIDRLIFNPAAMLSNKGKNAYDVLKVAPNVNADESGNISIKGVSGTGVLIDGRLLQMSGEQVMDYLKSIPSDDIYRIEIISNPSSKYDAEGLSGLINILLNKSQKKGLTGTGTLSYEQTTYAKYGGNINLNYRSSKVNLFGGTSLHTGDYLLLENVDNVYSRAQDPYYYFEKGRRVRKELSSFSKIGMDVYLSKKSTIGVRLEHSYNHRNGVQKTSSDFQPNATTIDSTYYVTNTVNNFNNNFTANLSYTIDIDTLGQRFSIDADYLNYFQPEFSLESSTSRLISQVAAADLQFRNSASQKIGIYSIRSDYSKPLNKKTWLDVGGKFYSLYTGNQLKFYERGGNNDWIQDNVRSSDFRYDEYNTALYAIVNYEFTDKFTAQAGLRNEFTVLSGSGGESGVGLDRSYNKLFPSVFLQFTQNEDHQLSLSYTSRISRPDYSNLNPFRYYITPNNYTVGDPFLQPGFTNSFDFSYLLKQNFYFSLYANLTNGQITQVPVLDPLTNSYKTISINLDQSYNYGLNVYLNHEITKWWQSSINMRAGLNGMRTTLNGASYSSQNLNVFIANNNQFSISSRQKIAAELNVMYQPKGYTQGLFTLGKMLDLSVSFRKTFKDNKCSLSVSFSDITNTAYIGAVIDETDQYSRIYGNYDKRGVQLTFSYKFGKKDIESSREKESNIESEKNRL